MDFYILGNTNNCVVKGVRDETGAFNSGAALVLNVYNREEDGTLSLVRNVDTTLPSWPFSFAQEGKGNYRVSLPPTLDLTPGVEYVAEITGTSGTRTFHESRRLLAKPRLTK